jgi:ATP dependent DNA ligase domain
MHSAALFTPPMPLRWRTLPAGFVEPCLPTSAPQPPCGPEWVIEIKHDGFRVIARKEGKRVRLYSRPGNDLTYRFPLIVDALAKVRPRSCIIGAAPGLGYKDHLDQEDAHSCSCTPASSTSRVFAGVDY